MDLTPIESSNIEAIGFDGERIQVRFHSGATWQYEGAEDMTALFKEFAGAESKGRFFGQHIRGRLQGERVG